MSRLASLKQTIVYGLIGCLEIVLLMPSVGKWFGGTRKDARWSFIIPVLLLPLSTYGTYHIDWSRGGDAYGVYFSFLMVGGFFTWIKYAIFLALVKLVLSFTGGMNNYFHFVVANNWMMFVKMVLLLPFWWMLYSGGDAAETYPYIVCTYFYIYLALSFAATRILGITLAQAGFIPLASFAANGLIFILFNKIGGMIVI